MRPATPARLAAVAMLSLAALGSAQAAKNDYPTTERVLYVHECMRQHPGNHFEMVSKCSCVIDKIADKVPFDDFEDMSTATNANSIGGERGNAIRDVAAMQDEIKRFRTLQAEAKKACFINTEPAK